MRGGVAAVVGRGWICPIVYVSMPFVRPLQTFQGVDVSLIFELIHKGLPSLMFRVDIHDMRD